MVIGILALQEEIGWERKLMMDANQCWDVDEAIRQMEAKLDDIDFDRAADWDACSQANAAAPDRPAAADAGRVPPEGVAAK